MTPHDPAQFQDGMYSIGGGSLFIRIEGHGDAVELIVTAVEPESPAVETPQLEPVVTPEFMATAPVSELTPIVVRLRWWRCLWIILNMDIRDLFRLR